MRRDLFWGVFLMFETTFLRLSCATAIALIPLGISATPAAAQARGTFDVPAMPLAEAIARIAEQGGVRIAVDPDAIHNLRSSPVRGVRTAEAAARAAVRGLPLGVTRNGDGSLDIGNEILVIAQRDPAETDVLVNQTSTSSRTGLSLRDQPRNVTIISSKLIEQQQALTIVDALRNAGGVTVNTGTVQGGNTYAVRGFASGGIVNGLPSGSALGGNAGVAQPIATVERIEVLKGPDALLAGIANLGGMINIVTKKPFAGQLLTASAETGSWGQARLTVDANNALNTSGTVSARITAVAGTADRNFGGYVGNEDYLFAPSLRFKNERTDIVLDVSASDQTFGANPFTTVGPTNQILDRPRNRSILSPDQSIRIGTTRLHADVTQEVNGWLTLAVRGQHEAQRIAFSNYATLGVIDAEGTTFVMGSTNENRVDSDAVDGFARIKLKTGSVAHVLVAGATHSWADTDSYSASAPFADMVDILTTRISAPVPVADTMDYTLKTTQFGQYAQYMASFWKLKLLAGVRRNEYQSTIRYPGRTGNTQKSTATTPNFGIVLDVTPNLTAYTSLLRGYSPTFGLDARNNKLPDIRSRNWETGVKLLLFKGGAMLNASYFEVRQSNAVASDPAHQGKFLALPGQQGKGIDINLTGRILTGWTATGSFTRTDYSMLSPGAFGSQVVGQPRDQYSVYSAYERKLADHVTAGLGAGLFGRSGASADTEGAFIVPAARQVDVNAFVQVGPVDLNLGVRNLLDRENYNITYTRSYLPYAEPRNWRLTARWKLR